MKYNLKFFMPLLMAGFFMTGSLIFSSCSSKYGQKTEVIKKWVYWLVEFKGNATEAEQAKVLIAVDKYIISHFDSSASILFSIHLSHYPQRETQSGSSIIVQVDIIGPKSTQAVPAKTPPRPGPRKELLLQISDKFIGISDLANGGNKRDLNTGQ